MVPRMKKDVVFLHAMFEGELPARRLIRGNKIARITYGFGDASRLGYGTSWVDGHQLARGEKEDKEVSRIKYRFGRWGKDGDGTSSNF